MTRSGRLLVLAGAIALLGTVGVTDAAAQRRGARVARPAGPARASVHARPVYRRVPYYSAYYPSSFYWGHWSPWYGGWPYWYGYGYGYYPYGYPWYRWPGPYYYNYSDTGGVRLQVTPRQAQVYVDGYFVGIVDDFDGTFQRLRLEPGGHEILLHLEGYRNASQKVYVQPQGTLRIRHVMEPLPEGAPPEPLPTPDPNARPAERDRPGDPDDEGAGPRRAPEPRWPPRRPAEPRGTESRYGSIAIHVQPSDAIVIVDGTEWRGPVDENGAILIQLPAGRHRIELRREGHETFATEVDVRAGVTTPVNVMLQER